MRILRTPVTAAATAAAVIIALTGCESDTADTAPDTAPDAGTDTGDTGTDTADNAAGDMEITSHGHTDHELWGPDAYVVTYKITNSGGEAASYFVSLEFLDSGGDYIGSTGITADHLGSSKSTEGDTAPLDVEIDHGDIADIADVRIGQVDRTAD